MPFIFQDNIKIKTKNDETLDWKKQRSFNPKKRSLPAESKNDDSGVSSRSSLSPNDSNNIPSKKTFPIRSVSLDSLDEKKSYSFYTLVHTWIIKNFELLFNAENNSINDNENDAIVLHSNSFPVNKNNDLSPIKFLIRLVAENNTNNLKQNEQFISLFLHLEKLLFINSNGNLCEHSNKNNIVISYKFLIQSNTGKTIFELAEEQTFSEENCFGFKNIVSKENLFQKLNLDKENAELNEKTTVIIKCMINIKNKGNEQILDMINFSALESITETNAGYLSTRFYTEVVVKNFIEKYFENKNNEFIESENFFSPENKVKFNLLLKKNDSLKNNKRFKEKFLSLYLKYNSENFAVYEIFWRASLLTKNKKSFLTGEGNGKFTSSNEMLGTPQFINEKSLLTLENGLITKKNLIFFVEINAKIEKLENLKN